MPMQPELRRRLFGWCEDSPLFVVADGAGYDDLPALLQERNLMAGSLFRQPCDPGVMKDGPFLVKVETGGLDAFLSLPDLAGNAVFWRVPDCTGHAFWRHLRTVALVRIPSSKDDGTGRRMRRAVFRHQDPDVMARMLPVLRPGQRARLFGPADALLLALPDGLKEARRQTDWPEPERGPLTLTPVQMQALEKNTHERSLLEIGAFLREAAPEETERLGTGAVLDLVRREEARGRAWGLESPRALGMFCWLALASDGTFVTDPDIGAYVREGIRRACTSRPMSGWRC